MKHVKAFGRNPLVIIWGGIDCVHIVQDKCICHQQNNNSVLQHITKTSEIYNASAYWIEIYDPALHCYKNHPCFSN